jgi:uncharacterized protein YdiU (UPF0061 family)
VIAAQARLVAQWMGLGFVHGVMNTDNMALSGETIDYGPCAFMEGYAPGTVFSSIDRQGRYAWANQPLILGWNLARLAECAAAVLIDADGEKAVEIANDRLGGIAARYRAEWLAVMRRKLALAGEDPGDAALVDDLLAAMAGADWTLTFRRLAGAVAGARACCRRCLTISPGWRLAAALARAAGAGGRGAAAGGESRRDPAQPPGRGGAGGGDGGRHGAVPGAAGGRDPAL